MSTISARASGRPGTALVAQVLAVLRLGEQVVSGLVRSVVHRRFPLEEVLLQTWYAIRVCTLPALAVSVPFGIILALQVGVLAQEVGAVAFTGAGNTLAVVRQAAPIITALMLAGVAGSAICADLGARRIREELDALEVMGIPVIERLVVPRVLAIVFVAVLLNGVVMFFTIMTTLLVSVVVQDLPPGSYLASVTTLAQPSDLYLSLTKAAVFAVLCAVVASHKGMTASRGPTGVGDAVTSAVVINFVLLFAANFVISQVHTSLVGGPLG
ncbi:MlaE family ABC transporter permease [Nocardioides massiliensis]|uniref:Phospholipid/cholesterol/gamma-HCH transport system permease protein n=1 Tax=Nocardioides massiliensis TaxID=1325935 RepID=A0ABT9NQA0_9ACTN|nr:ABC transporter permease [Nocardioides massiliensis]MDP9822359.1 phospholipid/cholesterol/gamma-HCH transport system permease protein [Nocardioides massiliensis]